MRSPALASMWPSGVTNLMVPASPVSVPFDRMHGATTFGHQKQLIVETVPMHGRPRFPCRDLEQHSGNPILGQRTIFIDANRHRPDMERFGLFFLVQLHRNRTSDRHCCDLLVFDSGLCNVEVLKRLNRYREKIRLVVGRWFTSTQHLTMDRISPLPPPPPLQPPQKRLLWSGFFLSFTSFPTLIPLSQDPNHELLHLAEDLPCVDLSRLERSQLD